jgi:hypothetical protein
MSLLVQRTKCTSSGRRRRGSGEKIGAAEPSGSSRKARREEASKNPASTKLLEAKQYEETRAQPRDLEIWDREIPASKAATMSDDSRIWEQMVDCLLKRERRRLAKEG